MTDMTRDEFVREIKTFLDESGMAPSIFGKEVMNDTAFVRRLVEDENRTVTLRTIEKFMDYMSRERERKRRAVA